VTESTRATVRDVRIGRYEELKDRERIVLDIDGTEVGVYFVDDELRAWLNLCPHQGGPVCQGKIMPRTVQRVQPDQRSDGLGFSETERNIVCPWHGFEYDVLTGEHPSSPGLRLRAVPVRVVDGDVVVSL